VPAAAIESRSFFSQFETGRIEKKPGKVWVYLDHIAKVRDPARLPALKKEQEILKEYIGNWDLEAIR
jgi:hypothetical protein